MERGPSGEWEVISTVGEKTARAFVPQPLPPQPGLELDPEVRGSLNHALLELGRLDSLSTLLPDTGIFLYSYIRKEAVLSSQIEGTQSSLSDLLLFELDEAPGVPIHDVEEVSRYVAALEHGLHRIGEGFPLSNRLIRELHEILLTGARGGDKQPGEFRRSQVWIGGSQPGDATFVPPPWERVPDCMSALETFVHSPFAESAIVKAALTHAQFETIHPFLDGNGRVGRLLITLLLCSEGILSQPLLYLSLYFKTHRDRYYELLQATRTKGDWEAWLLFFAKGVRATAKSAVSLATDLTRLFEEDHARISELRSSRSHLRLHQLLQKKPVLSIREAVKETGISTPTVGTAFSTLEKLGILREITGKKRGRVFAYDAFLQRLAD